MNILIKRLRPVVEFFLQYGWAIIIIIIALVALRYLNVLSPTAVIQSQCAFSKTFNCIGDPMVNFVTGEVNIEVMNNKEDGIKMLSWSGATKDCVMQSGFVVQDLEDSNVHYSGEDILGPGERALLKFTCGDGSGINNDFDTEITLTYVDTETNTVDKTKATLRKKQDIE